MASSLRAAAASSHRDFDTAIAGLWYLVGGPYEKIRFAVRASFDERWIEPCLDEQAADDSSSFEPERDVAGGRTHGVGVADDVDLRYWPQFHRSQDLWQQRAALRGELV